MTRISARKTTRSGRRSSSPRCSSRAISIRPSTTRPSRRSSCSRTPAVKRKSPTIIIPGSSTRSSTMWSTTCATRPATNTTSSIRWSRPAATRSIPPSIPTCRLRSIRSMRIFRVCRPRPAPSSCSPASSLSTTQPAILSPWPAASAKNRGALSGTARQEASCLPAPSSSPSRSTRPPSSLASSPRRP